MAKVILKRDWFAPNMQLYRESRPRNAAGATEIPGHLVFATPSVLPSDAVVLTQDNEGDYKATPKVDGAYTKDYFRSQNPEYASAERLADLVNAKVVADAEPVKDEPAKGKSTLTLAGKK